MRLRMQALARQGAPRNGLARSRLHRAGCQAFAMVIGVKSPEWCGPPPHKMIFYILPAPWAFSPAPSATLRRSAHHCATSTGTVQVPPARYAATLSDRHRPRASAEDRYRPMLSFKTKDKCDANHIGDYMCGLQDNLVGPSPHAGLVSKSRRKPVPRARKIQPDRCDQAPASQPGPLRRATRLSDAELLEQIRQIRIERDDAEAELAMLIDAAVSQGLGWPHIASQLGVTRQAARQQYQRRHHGGASHHGHVA